MEVMERGGGGGNFRAAGIFFRYKIHFMNFFKPWFEYFLIFPCAKIFSVVRHPPPPPPRYNLSNGRFVKGYVTLIAIF